MKTKLENFSTPSDNGSGKYYSAILLCGGKGTRLRSITNDEVPKSLYKIDGKELISYTTEILAADDIRQIIFAVDHKKEEIVEWTSRQQFGAEITFAVQQSPGVPNALLCAALSSKYDDIIICNADEVRVRFNIKNLLRAYEIDQSKALGIATHINDIKLASFSSYFEINPSDTVASLIQLDPNATTSVGGWIPAGMLVINKSMLQYLDISKNNMELGITAPLAKGNMLRLCPSTELVYFNINTPADVESAEAYLRMLRS